MQNKIFSLARLMLELNQIRADNVKIVFTNGCFDIIHSGHIQYLYAAKQFGDKLVIGLNSDESVTRLKGNSRPINMETDRAIVLSALEMVDYVVIFDEDTPYNLIAAIKPEILVKGGDWAENEIVGADLVKANGGLVKSLTFKEGYSTTNIINKSKIK